MNLKTDLAQLTLLLAKPDPKTPAEKELLAAQLLSLVGLVQNDSIEVPAEVFSKRSIMKGASWRWPAWLQS